MDIENYQKISFKLFVGVMISSEIKMHLQQSKIWKQIEILPKKEELSIIHFRGKEYLGSYLSKGHFALPELEQFSLFIKTRFKDYCPNFPNIDQVEICFFSQVFVA